MVSRRTGLTILIVSTLLLFLSLLFIPQIPLRMLRLRRPVSQN
jgi:hypothetical protein